MRATLSVEEAFPSDYWLDLNALIDTLQPPPSPCDESTMSYSTEPTTVTTPSLSPTLKVTSGEESDFDEFMNLDHNDDQDPMEVLNTLSVTPTQNDNDNDDISREKIQRCFDILKRHQASKKCNGKRIRSCIQNCQFADMYRRDLSHASAHGFNGCCKEIRKFQKLRRKLQFCGSCGQLNVRTRMLCQTCMTRYREEGSALLAEAGLLASLTKTQKIYIAMKLYHWKIHNHHPL